MPSVYSLCCTVCNNDFKSRSKWLKHLLRPEHQNLARKECLKSWGEDKPGMRECTVVVFCSFSLDCSEMAEKVIGRFSRVAGEEMATFVTDFVWWPERPKVGFLQFESRAKVTEIFETFDGPNVQVENKLVQLKKAVDILTLEWKELLPPDPNEESQRRTVTSNRPQNLASLTTTKSTDQTNVPNGSVMTSSEGVVNQRSITKLVYDETTGCVVMKRLVPAPSTRSSCIVPIPPSSRIPNPQTHLQNQFDLVCKFIEIPDEEFSYALEIFNIIKEIFTREHPSGKLVMFRNYYLRLRNTGTGTFLIYAYLAENTCDPDGFYALDKTIQESIFETSDFNARLPGFIPKKRSFEAEGGTSFCHKTSGLRFNFVTFPLTIVEANLCLLLQYLCTFDSRVKPLITLVYFWAKSHSVHISEEIVPHYEAHCNCPEPVALEWLVMLFLIHEGVVPSVREILQLPHKPLKICDKRKDVGFSTDPEFVNEWRRSKSKPNFTPDVTSDDFILEIVTLAQKFFQFYSAHLENGCWLLNPKDGEIIKREGTHCAKSSLSPEETNALTVLQSSENTRKHLIISDFRIYMLHPLYITWRLSFCVDTWTDSTCPKMKRTAELLKEYLSSIRSGSRRGYHHTLESILAGGQRQSKQVQLDLQCEMNQNLRTAIRTRVEQRKRNNVQHSNNDKNKRKKCK